MPSNIHPSVERAIQEIDSALFSSDEFEGENKENMAELRKWIDRWDARLKQHEMANERCQHCGGPNH